MYFLQENALLSPSFFLPIFLKKNPFICLHFKKPHFPQFQMFFLSSLKLSCFVLFCPEAGLGLLQNPQLGLLSLILGGEKMVWVCLPGDSGRGLRRVQGFWGIHWIFGGAPWRRVSWDIPVHSPHPWVSHTFWGTHQRQDPPTHSQILQNSGVSFSTHPQPWGKRQQNSKETLMLAVTWCHCFQCRVTRGVKNRWCDISCSL